MTTRRRLSPEQRRDALLDAGEKVFSARPFEEISMQDVAEAAGVTRQLLYHYYPTKAEFFGALWARAHERLRSPAARRRTPATVRDFVEVALRGYLDFYAGHLPLVLIANRSAIAREPAVRGPVEGTFALMCAAILDAAGSRGTRRRRAEVAFDAWIAFVRESALATYLDGRISPRANLVLCMAAFDATVGAHADLTRPMP